MLICELFRIPCRGVAGTSHSQHVWTFQKQCACWLQPVWGIQCDSRGLHEPSPKNVIQNVPGKTCRMTWSRIRWRNCKRSRYFWDSSMRRLGLQVSINKVLITKQKLDMLLKSGTDPYATCLLDLDANSKFVEGCSTWWSGGQRMFILHLA